MATKSKGVGRGGARKGAGRKSKPALTADELELALLADKSIDELMEIAVRIFAVRGHWDEASKAGARLAAARARAAAKPQQPKDPAPAAPSRFAPRPPPRPN